MASVEHDPVLMGCFSETLEHLAVTVGVLVIRFGIYLQYPAKLVLCCCQYNPSSWQDSIMEFLNAEVTTLDDHFGRLLFDQAWKS